MAVHYIHFGCSINDSTAAQLRNVLLQAVQQKADRIVLVLNCDGGGNHQGFGLYGFIRSLPIPVDAHNLGNVESMGVVLFLAADVRTMNRTARFVIHAMHWGFPNGANVDAARFVEFAESLGYDRERYAQIFDERTGGADEPLDIRPMLLSGHKIFGAEAALRARITTAAAIDLSIPADAINWWISP